MKNEKFAGILYWQNVAPLQGLNDRLISNHQLFTRYLIFHPDSYHIGVNLSKKENNVFCSIAIKFIKKGNFGDWTLLPSALADGGIRIAL